MSISESNSVGCSKLIDVRGCQESKPTKQGKHYSVDINNDPRVLFKDTIGNGREMKFKRNSTITITSEKIFYNRDDVEIKPASIT
ncbi:MAG: hypothetical protein KGH89_08220 [Thaumarchaeota archaeon]|nr:hypothetical protein [Nitrososphaerota archaeon]